MVTGAYALGHLSGGHFNPAVTLGLAAGGRFDIKQAPAYIARQVVGGLRRWRPDRSAVAGA